MVRPIEIQDNLTKAPLAARAQNLQQANSQAAQQQVNSELGKEHVLNQNRPVPLDEMDAARLNAGDRSHPAPPQKPRARREPLPAKDERRKPKKQPDTRSRVDYLA